MLGFPATNDKWLEDALNNIRVDLEHEANTMLSHIQNSETHEQWEKARFAYLEAKGRLEAWERCEELVNDKIKRGEFLGHKTSAEVEYLLAQSNGKKR